MKTQKDIDEAWAMADAHVKKLEEREKELESLIDEYRTKALSIADVSGSAFWSDDRVIDFVNWYIELHKLDFRYTIENRTIIESFKNGDDASKWHCH